MVSSKYFWATALVAIAGFAFTACEEKEEQPEETKVPAVVSLAADQAQFSKAGEASVTLTLSEAAEADVVVTLAAGANAPEGKTAVSAAALSFDSNVTIAAGTTSAKVPVTVQLDKADAYQVAVIAIAAATGADVSETASVAYIEVQLDLAGADVWGIIGGFNDWSENGEILLTKTSDSPETWVAEKAKFGGEFKFRGNQTWGKYDLGSSNTVVLDEELALAYRGSNITIDEGVYNVTLYPTELKAVISVVENPVIGNLDWNIEYTGCNWVGGYYSYGQLETLTVAETGGQYYHLMLLDLSEDDSAAELIAADANVYFAAIQEEIDEAIAWEMEYYGETIEEALYWLFYNEENNGTELLFYGQPVGDYEFVVLPLDENGKLTKQYTVVPFTKTEDPIAIYPWNESYNQRRDWTSVWDGWELGYEGKYYWAACKAPGAAYAVVDTYTEDELEQYYGGSVVDMYNYTASSIADYTYGEEGWTMEELAEYGVVLAPAEDGSFTANLSTYGMTGITTNAYIYAFDAEGHILQDYGVTSIDIPVYVEEQIEWVEHSDWVANYDASVVTEYEDYPQAVVVSACDAKYFDINIFNAGVYDANGIEVIAEYLGDWSAYMSSYTMDELVEYGAVGTCDALPFVTAWSGLANGLDIIVLGYNEAGKFTGAFHYEVLTGLEEAPAVEWAERTDWAVNYDASVVTEYEDYPQAVVVTACDAKYFDLSIFAGGAVEGYGIQTLADSVGDWTAYMDSYTMDDLVGYGVIGTPETLPFVTAWRGLANGLDIVIFAYDETGAFSGEWHTEPVTGVQDSNAAPRSIRSAVQTAKAALKIKSAKKDTSVAPKAGKSSQFKASHPAQPKVRPAAKHSDVKAALRTVKPATVKHAKANKAAVVRSK